PTRVTTTTRASAMSTLGWCWRTGIQAVATATGAASPMSTDNQRPSRLMWTLVYSRWALRAHRSQVTAPLTVTPGSARGLGPAVLVGGHEGGQQPHLGEQPGAV